jgi:chromosome segregation ATPase
MDINEVNKAAATLANTVKVLSPIVVALNCAYEVFSILKNATRHQEIILRENDNLRKIAEDLKAQAEASRADIPKYDAEAAAAHATAKQEIADAQQQAKTQVADILASVADSTKKAQTAFVDLQADIAAKTATMQKAYADESASLNTSKQELEAAVKALEAKLDKLKEQAKKFAASFAVE